MRITTIAMLAMIAGCAPSGAMRGGPYPNGSTDASPPSAPAAAVPAQADPADNANLSELWERRAGSNANPNQDYPIGPGDVLRVSVPQVEEINERKVRVSALGTIELPLLGIVEAGGLTEAGLAQDLDHRLEKY